MCVLVAGRAPDDDPRDVERSTDDGHRARRWHGQGRPPTSLPSRPSEPSVPGGSVGRWWTHRPRWVGRHRSEPTRHLRREAHGSDLRQVSRSPDGRAQDWTTFSPDGTRLLFMATDDRGRRAAASPAQPDGREHGRHGPAAAQPDWHEGRGDRPVRTADGLVAPREDDRLRSGRRQPGCAAVFVVGADDGEPRRITDWGTRAISVDWSPSGDSTCPATATTGSSRYGWSTPATVNAGCSGFGRRGVLGLAPSRRTSSGETVSSASSRRPPSATRAWARRPTDASR